MARRIRKTSTAAARRRRGRATARKLGRTASGRFTRRRR